MFVLPQILLLGGTVIEKSSFAIPAVLRRKPVKGRVRVDGVVRGEISGVVRGVMHATVEGTANLSLISGSVTEEEHHEDAS